VMTRPTRLAKSTSSSTSPAHTVRTATRLLCDLVGYSVLSTQYLFSACGEIRRYCRM
jgi:hypothetical protein